MTQEKKQLLLKDLSARLPYKPHVYIKNGKVYYVDIVLNGTYIHDWMTVPSCQNITIKPYLRPMSSMTEEEEAEYYALNAYEGVFPHNEDALDYVLEHHFDYRGLIEKGLALIAPEGMYNKN